MEVNGSPRVLEELNNLPIKVVNGATIYVHDVAQVRDGYQPQTNIVRKDGQRGVLAHDHEKRRRLDARRGARRIKSEIAAK